MRPLSGSDPQLVGINKTLQSLITRFERLERNVSENQFLITDLHKKIDQQTRMLELVTKKLGVEDPGDKLG